MNIKPGQKIFFVGIKGIAMAALAVLAKEKGYEVRGSDVSEIFPSDSQLHIAGIRPMSGFDAGHIRDASPDLVIYTGAHGGNENPEVAEAMRLNIPVLPHGKALGWFMEGYRQVSVAGCHGKTTTASMIASIATHSGTDPSYAIGTGGIGGVGAAGHSGSSLWFIAEADEYSTDPGHDTTPRFLWQHPEILVVTNIDFDHPDAYADIDAVKHAYMELARKVPQNGLIIYSSEDKNSEILSGFSNSVSVGTKTQCDISIRHISAREGTTAFTLTGNQFHSNAFTLRVPGIHNIHNAALAAAAAVSMGISPDDIAPGLESFLGAKRRFEQILKTDLITVYDDYAHHPAEIRATLAGARFWYPDQRIIAVFQPHTYSRTLALADDFSGSFGDADVVIISEIYASARETPSSVISGKTLVERTSLHHKHVNFGPGEPEILRILKETVNPKDVIIFMGAGDIYTWGRRIADSLKRI